MYRWPLNIWPTTKPDQLLWQPHPIPGGIRLNHKLVPGDDLKHLNLDQLKVLIGDLKPAKGQLGGDSSLSIHSTVNGRLKLSFSYDAKGSC